MRKPDDVLREQCLSTEILPVASILLLLNTNCIVFKYVLAYAPQVTLQMEHIICQCKVNGKSKLKQNCQHFLILDEFISLKQAESVSNTLEELLAFTALASESAASCTKDLDTEIYRFKCEYDAKYQKYLKQHMQIKNMGIR